MERGPKNLPAGRPAELVVEQDPQDPQGFYPVTQAPPPLPAGRNCFIDCGSARAPAAVWASLRGSQAPCGAVLRSEGGAGVRSTPGPPPAG